MNRPETTPLSLLSEVRRLTITLVEQGLADEFHLPVLRRGPAGTTTVTTPTGIDATVLANVSYDELYQAQLDRSAYNVKFLDGALAQLSYTWGEKELLTHRLSYLPAPDLLPFLTAPDLYLADAPFLEVVGSQVHSVPMRFDYDARPGVAIDGEHPVAHVTLGQYRACRIAATSALLPGQFIGLVVQAFYAMPSVRKAWVEETGPLRPFATTITSNEERSVHFRIP